MLDLPGLGTVVESDDSYYLRDLSSDDDDHQRTYRYPISETRTPTTAYCSPWGSRRTHRGDRVPLDWVNLFPEGGVLGATASTSPDGGQLLGTAIPGEAGSATTSWTRQPAARWS